MAETRDIVNLPTRLVVLESAVCSKMNFHKNAFHDYVDIQNAVQSVIEEMGKIQQEHDASIAAKEELAKKIEEQAAEIASLKKKLKESEASDTMQPQGTVQTRSIQKQARQFEGHAGEDAEAQEIMEDMFGMNNVEQGLRTELGDVRKEIMDIQSKLIKGFLDMSGAGRQNITIKYMGQLNERPFLLACLEKLPRREAEVEASRLCRFWHAQLMNPEWNPFKTDTVGCFSEETMDDDDEMLQGLRAAWGEEVYEALVNGFLELRDCGRLSDRAIVPVLWNVKEERKAALSEAVEYVCSQVKSLSEANGRASHGKRGRRGGRT